MGRIWMDLTGCLLMACGVAWVRSCVAVEYLFIGRGPTRGIGYDDGCVVLCASKEIRRDPFVSISSFRRRGKTFSLRLPLEFRMGENGAWRLLVFPLWIPMAVAGELMGWQIWGRRGARERGFPVDAEGSSLDEK
jgi:hypothetical protein